MKEILNKQNRDILTREFGFHWEAKICDCGNNYYAIIGSITDLCDDCFKKYVKEEAKKQKEEWKEQRRFKGGGIT